MAEPFQQPERRSFVIPAALACMVLVAAFYLARHFFPATSVDIAHVRTQVLDTHTVFQADTKQAPADFHTLGKQPSTADVLFVVATVRVDNHLRQPIDLDLYTLTLTDANGAELTVSAFNRQDRASAVQSFPALAPMLSKPLEGDTAIEPGRSAEGTLLFSLEVPRTLWEARRAAVVKVDVYHLPALYQTLPKS